MTTKPTRTSSGSSRRVGASASSSAPSIARRWPISPWWTPTRSWSSWGFWRTGKAYECLVPGLRGLRPGPGGAARGLVRPGQRCVHHQRCLPGGRSRRYPLSGHLRRRRVQPADHGHGGEGYRERGPGQPPQLVASHLPCRRWALVPHRPGRARRIHAGAGHQAWRADQIAPVPR